MFMTPSLQNALAQRASTQKGGNSFGATPAPGPVTSVTGPPGGQSPGAEMGVMWHNPELGAAWTPPGGPSTPGPTTAMAPPTPPKVFNQFGAVASQPPAALVNQPGRSGNAFGRLGAISPGGNMGGLREALMRARQRFGRRGV